MRESESPEMRLAGEFDRVLGLPDEASAILFEGEVLSWGEVRAFHRKLDDQLSGAGVLPQQAVGLLCRNNPPHAAALLYALLSGRPVVMVHTLQSAEAVAKDVAEAELPVIIARLDDWTPDVVEAARTAGSVGVRLLAREKLAFDLQVGLEKVGERHRRAPPHQGFLSVLSSGTTGKPKLIDIGPSVVRRAIETILVEDQPTREMNPSIAFSPISGLSGLLQLIANVCRSGAVYLLDRFKLDQWLAAIETCQPESVIMFPAMIHSILDANIPRQKLEGIRAVYGGSAPIEDEVLAEFEERYGIPVYWGYGATEFAGTATTWNPALRSEFGKAKRGSAGRTVPGVKLRIVDPETGKELPRGSTGLIEAQVELLGPDWIRTTDLAVLDDDDFLFLKGRQDQAIIRGGFKIIPDTVSSAFARHPAVREALAFGIPDARLGQVPVVALELRDGASATAEELIRHARRKLPVYSVPAKLLILPALPRTGSLKADLSALKAIARREMMVAGASDNVVARLGGDD